MRHWLDIKAPSAKEVDKDLSSLYRIEQMDMDYINTTKKQNMAELPQMMAGLSGLPIHHRSPGDDKTPFSIQGQEMKIRVPSIETNTQEQELWRLTLMARASARGRTYPHFPPIPIPLHSWTAVSVFSPNPHPRAVHTYPGIMNHIYIITMYTYSDIVMCPPVLLKKNGKLN